MKKLNFVIVILAMLCVKAYALSPYENRLMVAEKQRVGLIAFAQANQINELKRLAKNIESDQAKIASSGIINLSIYVRELNKQAVVYAYFESKDKTILGWEARLSQSASSVKALTDKLSPHARSPEGQKWLRMEWMNHIASDAVFPYGDNKISKMGLMSGLKPETELTYRQLHQLNWPGVVDVMVKSNYRNWTTFMVEVEDKLYLFTYSEYIGINIKADNKVMAADPSTQRWWLHTEPCLINLHGEGNWSLMAPLYEVAK